MPTMHGFGLGVPWAKQCAAGGSPPAPWTPADATPLFWVDIPLARANGRIFTTSAKTTAATALSDPVGAIVQEGSLGNDLIQATTSRRYTLSQMTDGQWAVESDGVDDALISATVAFATGAKTLGCRFEYHTALGATETDVLLTMGGSSAMTQIRIIGSSSASKGISLICDAAGVSKTMRRYSGFTVSAGTAYTLVLAYNGGAVDSSASYRLFIDGSEVTIDTTGSAVTGSSTTTLLCLTVANAPVSGRMSKVFVVDGDQSAIIADMQSYLVAA